MQAYFPQVLPVLDSLHDFFNFILLFFGKHKVFDFLLNIFWSDDDHELKHFFAFIFLLDLCYEGFDPFPVNFLGSYFWLCKRVVCSLNLLYLSEIISQNRAIFNPFLRAFLLLEPFCGMVESAQAEFKMGFVSNYKRNVSYNFLYVLNSIQFFNPDKCCYDGSGDCFFYTAPIILPDILRKVINIQFRITIIYLCGQKQFYNI